MEMFSLNTDYGLTRDTGFKTLIKQTGEKSEQRISKSTAGGRLSYKMKFTNRLTTDMQTALYAFYVARKGNFEAFNLLDPFSGATIKVRFKDGKLTEDFFMHLVENSEIEVIEVD